MTCLVYVYGHVYPAPRARGGIKGVAGCRNSNDADANDMQYAGSNAMSCLVQRELNVGRGLGINDVNQSSIASGVICPMLFFLISIPLVPELSKLGVRTKL